MLFCNSEVFVGALITLYVQYLSACQFAFQFFTSYFLQLQSAQSELRRIFVDSPPHVRMQILEQNRKLLQEKEARNASKVIRNVLFGHSDLYHCLQAVVRFFMLI